MKRKLLAILLAITMIFAVVIPAMAASNSQVVTGPTTRVWQDGFGFHCNECSGNGQTSVIYTGDDAAVLKAIAAIKKQPAGNLTVEKGDQKDIFGTKTYPITLERVGDTTTWNLMTGDDIVCATCGRTDWVTYSNQNGVINGKNIQAHHPILPPPPPPVRDGTLSIEKAVDGKMFGEWATDGDIDVFALISGISFKLFETDADGGDFDETAPIGSADLDFNGLIIFSLLPDKYVGWVAVVEYIEPGSLADELFEAVGPQYFYLAGQDDDGNYIIGGEGGFDFDALYELKRTGDIYVLGDSQLNANGNVQDIFVKDVDGEDWLSSFCAAGTSVSFGSLYKAANELADPIALAKATAALNYIFNKYGSVDSYGGWGNGDKWADFAAAIALYENDDSDYIALMSQQTRLLSQIAIWTFFSGHDINIGWYSDGVRPGIPDQYKLAIDDLLANGLTGVGDLKLAYLVDAEKGLEVSRTCQPQLVPYFGSGAFDNKTKGGFDGDPEIKKTINGELFGTWSSDYNGDVFELISGISFKVFATNANGGAFDETDPIGVGELDPNGTITFSDVPKGFIGWVAVVEIIEPGSLADVLFEDVGPQYFYFNKGVASGGGFDGVGPFTAHTGYGDNFDSFFIGGLAGIYNFYVKDANAKTFPSFCASVIGDQIGVDAEYIAGTLAQMDDIVAALNYINNKYGSYDSWAVDSSNKVIDDPTLNTKVVAQFAIWAILNGSPYPPTIAWNGNSEIDLAVQDVLANYAGATGLVDIVYLEGPELVNYGWNNFNGPSQPQIVPFVGISFDNKTKDTGFDGTMQAVFEIDGTRKVIEYGYRPDTKSASGSITADARGSTTHNWFGGTLVNVAAAMEAPVVVAQLRTGNGSSDIIPTGYEISIDENGDIWIDLCDIVTCSVSIQLLPIVNGKGVQDNNGGHVTRTGMFNTGLNVGDADEVFVYIHFDSLSYFIGTYTKYTIREFDEAVPYTGVLNLVVTNEAGDVIFEAEGTLEELEEYYDLYGAFSIPGDYPAGKYFATLSGDGFEAIDGDGEIINDGDVITFDFGSITVKYPDRVIDPGYPA